MVDSGAGATVVGPEQVKAVQAGEPTGAVYKVADGTHITNQGSKSFEAVTDDYSPHRITAQVTNVEEPLLSVGQVVNSGNVVVFSPKGSYIDLVAKQGPKGIILAKRIPLRPDGNVYKLNMCIPKGQKASFQGPAKALL